MEKFKIRASQTGKIMGARGLGKTGESYIHEWLIGQTFDIQKNVTSKYLAKGIQNEDESIELLGDHLGLWLEKNEVYFEDNWMKGTPDILTEDTVIDIKNSWSPFTFPMYRSEIPNSDYFFQLQTYMHLTGRNKAMLVYTLTDTPVHLIEAESKRFAFANGLDPDDANLYEEFEKQMTFGHVPIEKRIKIFAFNREDETIEKIKERVEECRAIINQINQ